LRGSTGKGGVKKLAEAFSPYARSLVIRNFNRQTDPYMECY